MGWKAIRDHYRIEHVVTVHGDGVEIRSPYGGAIARIDGNGRATFETSYRGGGLERIETEITADPDAYRRLLAAEDRFESDVTVYTWRDGEILEKKCEMPGWPNVTHDGELMHENTHSTDREQAVEWALADAEAVATSRAAMVEEAERELERRSARLGDALAALARIKATAAAEGRTQTVL